MELVRFKFGLARLEIGMARLKFGLNQDKSLRWRSPTLRVKITSRIKGDIVE